MRATSTRPTGVERTFGRDEIIVTKTDLQGRITYANDVFLRMSAYAEHEMLGQPHSMIRHPEMPRAVLRLLWDTLEGGRELFAYVVNLAGDGAHYWVLAHVTPSVDASGAVVGYHSNRRVPSRSALQEVQPLYRALLQEEARHGRPADAVAASTHVSARSGEVMAGIGTTIGEMDSMVEGITAAVDGGREGSHGLSQLAEVLRAEVLRFSSVLRQQ